MDIVRLIKVFIASPSDTTEQRDEIEKVIQQWNAGAYFQREKIVLLPLRWESNTSSEYGENLSGQEAINGQLLMDSDILIAVFGNSLGSPVDGFESGTVAEIETFYKEKKSGVGVFFINRATGNDILPDKEYLRVKNYQTKLQNEKRGLYKPYSQQEIMAFLNREVSSLKSAPIKNSDGYYEMTISDVFKNQRGNFYLLDGRIPLADPKLKHIDKYEKNETHWVADWNKEFGTINKGDVVKFRIKKISEFYRQGMNHEGNIIYPRNITCVNFKIL